MLFLALIRPNIPVSLFLSDLSGFGCSEHQQSGLKIQVLGPVDAEKGRPCISKQPANCDPICYNPAHTKPFF